MRRARQLHGQESISRREVLGRLAFLVAGAATTACTPLRVVLHMYPEEFDTQPDLVQRVLGAFLETVVPGAPSDDPNLARAYLDPDFPLAKYAGYLASDLCKRSKRMFANPNFETLTGAQRAAVVENALRADGTTARLYNGAIYLGQVAFYAGIYDDDRGCPLIGFEGRYRFRGLEATSYPHPERYLARAITVDGNPA